MLVLMLWVLLKGSLFILFFFAQICINKKKLHGVLLSRDNHSTTMQGTVMFIQSEPAARSVHTPLLEASLRVRSLDWRRERLEIDWQRIQPYCGTVEGTRPDARGYIWVIHTGGRRFVSPPRSLCVTLLLLNKELWLTMSVVFFLQETGDQRNIEPVHTCS